MRQLYRSYVIRCWQEVDDQHKSSWRFVLEVPATGDRQGFTNLPQLTTALAETLEQADKMPKKKELNMGTAR